MQLFNINAFDFLGNSLETEGVWTFDNGVEMDWMPDIQFSATSEYGLYMNTEANNRAGLWYDAHENVSDAYYFICEKEY